MVDHVDGDVVDDARVVAPDDVGLEAVKGWQHAHGDGIVAVFTQVGDHVGQADHASFEGGGSQALDGGIVERAFLDQPIKLRERFRVSLAKHLLGELAVVAQRTVKHL